MTTRDEMLSVYRVQNTGRIPWAAYHGFLLPAGRAERELRNRGCGSVHWTPVCTWLPPGMSHLNGWMYEATVRNVELSLKILWKEGKRVLVRTYETPLGSVSEELSEEPGYHSRWISEFFVKKLEDYKILKYIVENTSFQQCYDSWCEAESALGEDGVELAIIDKSPFQKVLIELCGTERLSYDLCDNPAVVEDLISCIEAKEDEALAIIADSPAKVVWMVDNLTSDITEPRFFEKYCLPFYNKCARVLHKKRKSLAVHLDGKLKSIKDLIAATEIDVIESFTLPEMGGNLALSDASEAWKGKSIIANIPANLCYRTEREIREYLVDLLKTLGKRRNFMLELSENFPPQYIEKVLNVVAEVFEKQ
jgi:hypothetical protein